MKVNKNYSLDLEVVQKLEELRLLNPKFNVSGTLNKYFRFFFGLDKVDGLIEVKEELEQATKDKEDN